MSHFGLGLIAGQGTPGNDSFVKALLHFDGANGSTTFTDVNAAGVANTWAAGTTQQLTTSDFKFGGSSLYANGGIIGISTSAKAALAVGTSDFTIDFWFNNNGGSASGATGMAGYGSSTNFPSNWGWSIGRDHLTGTANFQISDGTNVFGNSSSATVNTGWHHIAISRASGTIRFFIDGILQFSFSAPNAPPSLGSLKILAGVSSTSLGTWLIDEFRYSIGIARWTANFTPPTSAYT